MTKTLTEYKIFIASPGGLESERRNFRELLHEYNEAEANHRGSHFTPVGWEITLGKLGRPQATINNELKECDYFVLILHDRWGQSPFKKANKYSSGTEEEYHIALECYSNKKYPMRQLVMFFKAVEERQLTDPGDQLKKVLQFRKEREVNKDILYHTYDTVDNFKALLRRHFAQWVRDHETQFMKSSFNIPIFGQHTSAAIADHEPQSEDAGRNNYMLNEAKDLASQGQILEAEVKFSQLILYSDDPWTFGQYAYFLRKIGQLSRANIFLDKTIELSLSKNDNFTRAYAIRQKGHLYQNNGKYSKALDRFNDAIMIYKSLKHLEGQADVYRDIGIVSRKICEFDHALASLEQSRAIYKEIENKKGVSLALSYMGVIHKSLGDFSKALKYHNGALSLLSEDQKDDNINIASIWGNLGIIFRIQHKFRESLHMHEKALEVFKSFRNIQGIVREKSNLGALYLSLGTYDKAQEMYTDALSLSETLGNQYSVAIQYGGLGMVYRLLDHLDNAEKYHFKSLSISEDLQDKENEAFQLENIGLIRILQNNYDSARICFKKALRISKSIRIKLVQARVLMEIGKIYYNTKDTSEARIHLEKSLEMFRAMSLSHEVKMVKALLSKLVELHT